MKKGLLYTFIFAIIVCLIIVLCRRSFAGRNDGKIDDLQLKADTALLFCKQKNFNTDFCILIDMKIPSGKNRFFVWDFNNDSIIKHGLVAHGCGGNSTKKTPEFSNDVGSNCTSLGKYKIGSRAWSNYGINVHYKLHGLEATNSNAFQRIVVLHSFSPVPEMEIYPLHLPMGYSLGCPVIDNETMRFLDKKLQHQQKPTMLWIYY